MTTTADVKPGDTIVYTVLGGGERTVVVEEVEEDIKNGEPGFCGKTLQQIEENDDFGVWGYLAQITEINGRWVR